jgi:hypothetical protein
LSPKIEIILDKLNEGIVSLLFEKSEKELLSHNEILEHIFSSFTNYFKILNISDAKSVYLKFNNILKNFEKIPQLPQKNNNNNSNKIYKGKVKITFTKYINQNLYTCYIFKIKLHILLYT